MMHILDGVTGEQAAFWDANGFLLLPGFYSHEQIDALDEVTEWMWREKPTSLTVDHNVTLERSRFCDIDGPREGNRFKLNDIYLLSDTMRRTILDPRLTPILAGVLGDDPVLINTLTIDLGTTQNAHVDSLFMTPMSDDALIATWTALEDVAVDAGPLFYYPGSHKLEPYRFSSGLQHIVDGEFDGWNDAIHSGMRELGIERQTFLAKKGDVFVWHARLVHGGSEILDPLRTRKSLVAHFFTKTDCVYHDMAVRRIGDGYWFNRGPQAAPATGERLTLPASPVVSGPFGRSNRAITINIDFVTVQGDGRRLPPSETLRVAPTETLLIRGWGADLERGTLPSEVLVDLGGGTFVRARSGIGRHDLVSALGGPVYANAGFLACIDAARLRPGRNVLTAYATSDDAPTTLHTGGAATVTVDRAE
jgi:hypothetical protein